MAKVGLFDRELAPDEWFDADADLELTVEYVETSGALPERTGTGATTAPAQTQTAAGTVLVDASSAATAAPQTQASAGAVAIAAAAATSSAAQGQAATGTLAIAATSAASSPGQVQASQGTVLVACSSASSSAQSPPQASAGSGLAAIDANGSTVSPAQLGAGEGTVTDSIIATGATTAPAQVSSGTGTVTAASPRLRLSGGSGRVLRPRAKPELPPPPVSLARGATTAPAQVSRGTASVAALASARALLTAAPHEAGEVQALARSVAPPIRSSGTATVSTVSRVGTLSARQSSTVAAKCTTQVKVTLQVAGQDAEAGLVVHRPREPFRNLERWAMRGRAPGAPRVRPRFD